MAVIGSMGSVTFTVSSRRVRTFNKFQRSGSAKLATHDIICQKGETEYTGLDPENLSLDIQLRRSGGVDPQYEYKKLKSMMDTGKVFPLILGGRPVGSNYWVIKSLSEAVLYWTRSGLVETADVSVALQEYKTDAAVSDDSMLGQVSDRISEVKDTVQDKLDQAESVVGGLLGGMF